MADIYVRQSSDIPKEPHWSIITSSSIHIPGDERSRTAPGHGYPAHNELVINYEAYLTEETWIEAINKLETSSFKKAYVAMKVYPAKIEHYIKPVINE